MTCHTTTLDAFYCTQFDCMMEIVEKWPNADYYIPKLRRLRTHLMENGSAAFQPDPNHFNTLIQGDLFVQFFLLICFFLTSFKMKGKLANCNHNVCFQMDEQSHDTE